MSTLQGAEASIGPDSNFFEKSLLRISTSAFRIPTSNFLPVPDLTQEFQTARLFAQMVADKFFQKLRAFFKRLRAEFHACRFGYISAGNP